MVKRSDDALSIIAAISADIDNPIDNIEPSYKSNALVSKYPVRSILIADIIEDSDVQFREKPFDPEHNEKDASLLATMGDPNIGLLQPIMVQEFPGSGTDVGIFCQPKKYKMVFGHNRRDAAKMLGWEKIQAHVAKAGEDVAHFTFVENDSSKPQSPYELAMTLRKYYDLHPSLTQTELAEKVGRKQSFVSQLIQTVKEDTPKPLVSLFARGMAVMTVLALKPVFLATDPSFYDRLAETVDGCSIGTAKALSIAVVEQKMDPFEATAMCGISQKKVAIHEPVSNDFPSVDNGFSVEAEAVVPTINSSPAGILISKPLAPLNNKTSANSNPQSTISSSRLPTGIAADNDGVVTKLAIDNGTSKFLVKKLIVKARAENLSYEELNDACLISARCENADQAVAHLITLMADARAFSAFSQYARSARLALRTMAVREKDHDFAVATALRVSIIVPLPLVPESPQKKR